jgi:hypothetical protein
VLPETFRDFRLAFGRSRVWRQKRMREKPGFPGHSYFISERRLVGRMPGWRRSPDRTRLWAKIPANREFFREFLRNWTKCSLAGEKCLNPQRFFTNSRAKITGKMYGKTGILASQTGKKCMRQTVCVVRYQRPIIHTTHRNFRRKHARGLHTDRHTACDDRRITP